LKKPDKIGNHSNSRQIDEDRLLAYLEGTLPAQEQHALEEILEADPFLNDAVEGLAEIKDKEQLRDIAAQINNQLKKQIQNRRKQRRARTKLSDHWGGIFVLVLLLLILLSWLVIKAMVKAG
jgi:anti-sigma factor RsiW